MSNGPEDPGGKSWLEARLTTLDKLYERFGRDGLKDEKLCDVNLLLGSKELAYRDAPKGRELPADQKEANRLLELEIRDINGYVNSLLSGAGLYGNRTPRLGYSQEAKPKPKDREPER